MEVQGFLFQAIVYLSAALVVVPISRALKLGSIIGYLVAGLLIGPGAFGIIKSVESVMQFAELGVVLLLFVIGLELQPEKLRSLRRWIFGMGPAQMGLNSLVLASILYFCGIDSRASIVLGISLALSSTAFVLQMLGEREELGTDYGRGAFSVLILQDLAVIPLLAFLPLMADGGSTESSILFHFARSALVIFTVILVGKIGLRHIYRIVAKTKTKEIFTGASLLLVLGISAIMHHFELSMGLGAFIAGLLLADSEYRHEIEADIEPFKGLLMGLFFISVGMALKVDLIFSAPLVVIGLVIALIILKSILMYPIAKFFGFTTAGSVNLSVSLAQGSEFAFVVLGLSLQMGLIQADLRDMAALVVTLSMAVSPFVYGFAKKLIQRSTNRATETKAYDNINESNPVIIAGFGRFGQMVGRTLRMKGIPFTALEHDPSQVETIRKFGNKIFYGDASRLDLLEAAKTGSAKVFVLAIDDPDSSVETAAVIRKHFPKVNIVARARNRDHYFKLRDLGITIIIRETFYSGIEAAKQTLLGLGENQVSVDIALNYFVDNDFKLIEEQYIHSKDEESLIAVSRRNAVQLSQLFQGDTKT